MKKLKQTMCHMKISALNDIGHHALSFTSPSCLTLYLKHQRNKDNIIHPNKRIFRIPIQKISLQCIN